MIDNSYPQAVFDPRILNLPFPGGLTSNSINYGHPDTNAPFQRGYIKQAMSMTNDQAEIYSCAFLYNPTTVQLTHALDSTAASQILPQYQRNPNDTSTYYVGLATTLSFSILFDRTYEVNMVSPSGTPIGTALPGSTTDVIGAGPGTFAGPVQAFSEDPRILGVLADVRALYRICGITNQVTGVSWQGGFGANGQTNVTGTANLTGVMQQVPAWAYFGPSGAPNSLAYYGYLSGINVEYTHFTQDMTAMRCGVDLTMTLLPSTS